VKDKVLLVEDDAGFLKEYKGVLEKQFNIEMVLGNGQGLASVSGRGPYAVVVSDFGMPGMDGIEFLSLVRKIAANTVCIMITGASYLENAIQAVNDGTIFQFLIKPFKPHVFAKALNAGIDRYAKICQVEKEVEEPVSSQKTKKILVVDDDPIIRSIASGALKAFDEFIVLTAENGKVASRLLDIIKIDLVLTDLEMPEMNGLQLISHMAKSNYLIPVIALTWVMTPETQTRLEILGVSQYLEKPLDMDALIKIVFQEINSGTGGEIHGISIAGFLQLVETEEKTCTLTIRSDFGVGYLDFLKGGLIAAETGELRGEEAAYQIIAWEESAIEIQVNRNMKKKRN